MAKTGTALLKQPQREWIDLQKLLMRQRPSKETENTAQVDVQGLVL
jgi:hypothetical protein